jgi:hypothetical protein
MNSLYKQQSARGSVLIVALVFATLIAISLVSYISLANNSLKQASRSFYANSAINLAEVGLELAMARFNQLDDAPDAATAWGGWMLDPSTGPFTPSATRTFGGYNPGPGAIGTIKVFAQHYPGSTTTDIPRIVAKATITQNNAPPIEKYIEVTLRKREILGRGISSLDDINVNGARFEGKSWNSNGGTIPYTAGPITANLTVGSVNGDIDLGSKNNGGTIWGYAKVSEGNTITGGLVSGTDGAQDADRRLDDFDGNFPMPETPTGFNPNSVSTSIIVPTAFPDPSDTSITDVSTGVGAKTTYYYVFTPTASISLSGNATDVISIPDNTNVVFIMNNRDIGPSAPAAVNITSNASIRIGTNSTLHIYSDGNINITGGGLVNANISPSSFMFWGTQNASTTYSPDVTIHGNGVLTGIIYAPGADLNVGGGGSGGVVTGAVVAKSVEFAGNTSFYYDESLAGMTFGNPYGASKWKELQTAAERASYSSALSF